MNRRDRPNRHVRSLRRAVCLLLVCSVGLLAAGCAGSRRMGGSSLTEAVEEAGEERRDGTKRREDERKREGKKTKRKVLHAGRRLPEPVMIVVDAVRSDRHRRSRREAAEPLPLYVALSGGKTSFGTRQLDESRFLALRVGGFVPEARRRLELGLELAGTAVEVVPRLAGSLHDLGQLSLGLSARYYTEPVTRPVGIYGTAGFVLGALWWDYASPILIEDDHDIHQVDGDWMGTYSPYVGLGLTLSRRHGVRLGTSLVAGYTFFDDHTHEGLYNDLFDPAPFVQVRFELGHAVR